MSRQSILVLVASLGLAMTVGAWFWMSRGQEVATASSHRGTAVDLVYATGFVEPEEPVSVSARVTAPVTLVFVKEGERVRKGQPLLRLDDTDLRGVLTQARAQSRGASLAEARTLALFREGWVTRAARDIAVAEAEAARAATAVAQAKLDQNVVRAGVDGIVIKRDVETGDLATPSRVLMLLGDPSRTRVTATIDERDIPRVHVGQFVLLSSDAWPDRIVRGHVRELTPGGDPTQRAFRARLAIDDRARLPIGMSLEANIVTQRIDGALLIPNSALAESRVWVIANERARRIAVTTGIVGAQDTEIRSGLSGREILIDPVPSELREGARVRVRPH